MARASRSYVDATRVSNGKTNMRILLAMVALVAAWVIGCSDDGVFDPVEASPDQPDAGEYDAAQATDLKDAGGKP